MNRIILIHWNKQTGPEPIIQFPPEKPFPTKELFLGIWAKHELNKENSIIEFTPEDNKNYYLSIINYSMIIKKIYFLLLEFPTSNVDSDIYKEFPHILATISKDLIDLVNTNKITRAISKAFYRLQKFYLLNPITRQYLKSVKYKRGDSFWDSLGRI